MSGGYWRERGWILADLVVGMSCFYDYGWFWGLMKFKYVKSLVPFFLHFLFL